MACNTPSIWLGVPTVIRTHPSQPGLAEKSRTRMPRRCIDSTNVCADAPAGGPCVYQLPLPTTGASALVFGPSDYGGALSLSPDAQLLVVEGYNVPAGSYSGSSIDP